MIISGLPWPTYTAENLDKQDWMFHINARVIWTKLEKIDKIENVDKMDRVGQIQVEKKKFEIIRASVVIFPESWESVRILLKNCENTKESKRIDFWNWRIIL